MNYTKGRNTNLYRAILLGAFGAMRRGEVCGLNAATDIDFENNTIRIHKSRVMNSDRVYVNKAEAKTEKSNRIVQVPASVINEMPKEGDVVSCSPHAITESFRRAVEALNLNGMTFHSLRHYAASIMHAQGIPDQYILEMGGWSTDFVLKQVYRNTLSDYQKIFSSKINSYFDNLLS